MCGPQAAMTTSKASSMYYWANKNGDATCTGASLFTAPSNLANGPTWSWKDKTASIVSTHPCIDTKKNIYLSNRNGMVRKFSPSGTILWVNKDFFRGQASQVLVGGCVILSGFIHVGFSDGKVASINMETARSAWHVQAVASSGGDSWSLAAHSGMVLTVGRSEGYHPLLDFGGNNLLVALDAHNGTKRWVFRSQDFLYNFLGSF